MDETLLTSPMYRDIIGPSNSTMGAALGLGMPNPYYNTNFLGGVRMAGPLSSDVYSSVAREKQRNIKDLKHFLIGIGGLIGTIFVTRKLGKLWKGFKGLFKSTP